MKKHINALVARIRLSIVDRLTPSAQSLLTAIGKLEYAIERTIEKDNRTLEGLFNTAVALDHARKAKNRDLDLAYKLLNNVSRLTR